MTEIGDREQGHARGIESLDQFEAARHRAGDRLVETRRIGIDQRHMIGEPRLQLGQHVGKQAAGVGLEMPPRRDDVRHEPFQLVRIGNQLGKEIAQVPVEQHAADVENDRAGNGHKPLSFRRGGQDTRKRRRKHPTA